MPHSELMLSVFPHDWRFERGYLHCGESPGHGVQIGSSFVVVVKGEEGRHVHRPVSVSATEASITVEVDGRAYELTGERLFRGVRVLGQCNGRGFAAQVEREGVWIRVAHNGRRIEATHRGHVIDE